MSLELHTDLFYVIIPNFFPYILPFCYPIIFLKLVFPKVTLQCYQDQPSYVEGYGTS